MLSEEEKKEMLEDGRSNARRANFRFTKGMELSGMSFDEYLHFLNDVQKIFSPFEISSRITPTKENRL